MEKRERFCPFSEKCSYENIPIEPNSYFLIEPFDNAKNKREGDIWNALETYYLKFGVKPVLKLANLEYVHIKGLYCGICSKIQSSEFCIVDVTGEICKIKLRAATPP